MLFQAIFLHRKFQAENGKNTRLKSLWHPASGAEAVAARDAQIMVVIIGFHLQ